MKNTGIVLVSLIMVLIFVNLLILLMVGKVTNTLAEHAKNEAIETLTNYGGMPLKTSWNGIDSTITYHTCWEITDEEIQALYVLSKDFEIILYTE